MPRRPSPPPPPGGGPARRHARPGGCGMPQPPAGEMSPYSFGISAVSEPEANSPDRDNPGAGPEFASHAADVSVNGPAGPGVPPDLLNKPLSGNHGIRIGGEDIQQVEFLARHLDGAAVDDHGARHRVDLERTARQ